MKIILTVHQFLPDFSAGTEVITLGIARELLRRGHEVLVVTGFPNSHALPDEERFDSYVYEGIDVERFRHSQHPMGEQKNIVEMEFNNRLFHKYFLGLLRREKPDIVHFIHLGRLSASAILACEELGVPTVFTATDFALVCPFSQLRLWDNSLCQGPTLQSVNCVRHHLHRLDQARRNKLLSTESTSAKEQSARQKAKSALASAIVPVARRLPEPVLGVLVRAIHKSPLPLPLLLSQVKSLSQRPDFMREQMNKVDLVLSPSRIVESMLLRNGLEPARSRLLPYGIDLSQIRRHTARGEQLALRVGFVGAVSEHKGCHLLVEAACALQEAPLEVAIFGDFARGAEGEAYRKRLKEMIGSDTRIELRGRFDNARIGDVLSGLDVLVVPSIWYENTPIVIYEALASGCPVVATDLAGISEIVRHEENGLLFPKGDAGALAASLKRLLEDRALLKRLAFNTRAPQSVPDHVEKLEGIYSEVLERRAMAATRN